MILFNFHISKEQNEAAIDFPVHLSIDAAGMVSRIVFDILVCALVLKYVCACWLNRWKVGSRESRGAISARKPA